MKDPLTTVPAWSSRHPLAAIAIVLVVAAGLGAGMGQTVEGRFTELFVPDSLESLDTLHDIEDIWGESEPATWLYLVDDPTDPGLIRAMDDDKQRLVAAPEVQGARSYSDIIEAMVGELDDATDAEIRAAAQQAMQQGRADGFAVDDATLIRIDLEPSSDLNAITDALDALAADSDADADLRSTGFLYVERMQTESATSDVGILMPLSMVVVVLVLTFLFRRVQDVVVPIVTSLVAIVMAYGTVAWAQLPILPPSFIVMPLLLGLGVDYMLHIIYVYREQDPELDIQDRFSRTGASIGRPVFFTAITTLIGFASFLASGLPQIRIWGLLIGTGALYAFLLGFFLMPALYRLGRRKKKPNRQPLARLMEPVARFVPSRPWVVVGVVAVITAGFVVAATQIHVTPELEFEPDENEPEVRDFNAVQDRFGGQTFALFLIAAGDRAALEQFEDDVAATSGVGFVDGPTTRLERAGDPDGALVQPATDGVATADWWLVIAGYEMEDGDEVIDDLEQLEESTTLDARLTGQDRIQRESDAQFLPRISASTGIALGLVSILLFVVFRNVLWGALALMPLLVTIGWQLGIQTLTGIPLNPITATMTAMMIGVGVDFSIHVMSHYRRDRKAGVDATSAAAAAIRSVGKPVLAATITTVFAFSVLGFSSLLPLRDFGRVAAIVVACAFILSLTLLPAVLTLVGRARDGRASAAAPTAARGRALGTQVAPRSPNDRFTVKPRFSDPAVQDWFEDTWQSRRRR